MQKETRELVKSLMRRYIADGTREGLFHALVLAKVHAEDSAYFNGVLEGFPDCDVSYGGHYLVDGEGIRKWLRFKGELQSVSDQLMKRIS